MALEAVRALLAEGGIEAVTIPAVAARLPVGRKWLYTYIGDRKILLATAAQAQAARAIKLLGRIENPLTPTKRVRLVLDVLLPDPYRGSIWLLVLTGRYGLPERDQLAQAIGNALAPGVGLYAPAIGGGLLGVLGEALGPWNPSLATLRQTASDMILSVALFREAVERRGKVRN